MASKEKKAEEAELAPATENNSGGLVKKILAWVGSHKSVILHLSLVLALIWFSNLAGFYIFILSPLKAIGLAQLKLSI